MTTVNFSGHSGFWFLRMIMKRTMMMITTMIILMTLIALFVSVHLAKALLPCQVRKPEIKLNHSRCNQILVGGENRSTQGTRKAKK